MLDRRRVLMAGDNAIDLSFLDVNGNYTFIRETANCYVIKEPGNYKFPLVPGCAIKNSSKNPRSYTKQNGQGTDYFNDVSKYPGIYTDNDYIANVIFCDVTGFTISDIKIKQGTNFYGNPKFYSQLYFKVDTIPQCGGNAIIALKDGNEEIKWSWHIWAYPFELKTLAYRFLNVNVGFVKNSINSDYGTSPYYQWGRKDPMLRSGATAVIGQFTISNGPANSTTDGVRNPTTFYKYASNYYYNWYSDTSGANHWNANAYEGALSERYIEKTVYDPCPPGFVVPSNNKLTGFTTNNAISWNSGYTFRPNVVDDPIYFPALGMHQGTSTLYQGNIQGFYWTGRAPSTQRNYFWFRNGQISATQAYYPFYGMPIRPIMDKHVAGFQLDNNSYALYTDKFNDLDGQSQEDAIADFNKYFGDFYDYEWDAYTNEAMRIAIDQAWSYDKCDCWELADEQFEYNGNTYCLWVKGQLEYFILTDSLSVIKSHYSDFMCNDSSKRYCPIYYILNSDYDIMYQSGSYRIKHGIWDDTYDGIAVYSLGWSYLNYYESI